MAAPFGTDLTQPFFRPSTKVLTAAVTFVAVLAVQAGVALTMHATASDAVNAALGTELQTVAKSAASAVSVPLERRAPTAEVGAMLRRVREAHRLEEIVIVAREGTLLADHRGTEAGVPCSIFAATPALVRHAFHTAEPIDERITMLGDPYRRVYFPLVRDGRVWGVLCLSVYDRVPAGLQALAWPLELSLSIGVVTAIVLAVLMLALMRFFDRSKMHLLKNARLAAAGTLAATIAHDVRNPMAVILSTAQVMLREKNLSPAQREMLEIIEGEIRQADEQLDAFLDLTRDMPLNARTEDVTALVYGTVELFSARARQTNVTVTVDAPAVPIVRQLDRRRIRQALANLLLNAAEAVESRREVLGEIVVRVRETADGSGPPGVSIDVCDNGPGIPPAQRDLVFEPFFSTKPDGTGVGLSSARQVARRHGGELELISSGPSGTTIRMVLPGEAPIDSEISAHPHRSNHANSHR